jgi:2',3'-cyclic-nucleotide 2'-phosphodiesterase (5'-nucleotidase family)
MFINNIKPLNILIAVLLFAAFSCTGKQYEIKEVRVSRVRIDSAFDSHSDTPAKMLVDSFKTLMDTKINEEIGFAAVDMANGKPQGLLGNFTADAMFDFGVEEFGNVDFAITNVGGIRSTVDMGPVTVGKMYEVYPFENRIVLLELKGSSIEKLFNSIAAKGGEALSKNVELVINSNKTESLKIGGKAVDAGKTYRIVTVDYLAGGNDGMTALTEAVSTTESNMLIRNLMISHIRRIAAENGEIEATLDNRIKII